MHKAILTLLIGSLMTVSAHRADAGGFIGDAWDVVTDPLKAGAATENVLQGIREISAIVDRLNAHLLNLEGKTNEDIKARIVEANEIVDNIRAGVREGTEGLDELVKTSVGQMRGLEAQIYSDTRELLVCSTALLEKSVQVTLAEAINQLAEARPGLDLLGWRIVDFTVTSSEITDPYQDWVILMTAYRRSIDKLSPDDPGNSIIVALANMQRVTLRTKCHYDGTSLEPELVAAYAGLLAEAAPWVGQTDFSIPSFSK